MAKRFLLFAATVDRPLDVSGRRWKEAQRAGWYAVGKYYDEVIKPRKFAQGADTRYGFKPRSPGYLKRKEKERRDPKSLVYGGKTRTAVMRRHYPRAFPSRVSVDLPTPTYIVMRPRRANHPNMGAELTSITADEYREMERVFVAAVEAFLAT